MMVKGTDIHDATRPTQDDLALIDLRAHLRAEYDHQHSLTFKLRLLATRLQTALDAGRHEAAAEAARLFARFKDDLAIRRETIIDLNREIAAIDPNPQPAQNPIPAPRPVTPDALLTRVLQRFTAISTPNPIPS